MRRRLNYLVVLWALRLYIRGHDMGDGCRRCRLIEWWCRVFGTGWQEPLTL